MIPFRKGGRLKGCLPGSYTDQPLMVKLLALSEEAMPALKECTGNGNSWSQPIWLYPVSDKSWLLRNSALPSHGFRTSLVSEKPWF